MGCIQYALVDRLLQPKALDDGADRQQVDLEAAARHRLDPLDIVPRHVLEDFLGAPGGLHLEGHGLRPRYLREGQHRARARGG